LIFFLGVLFSSLIIFPAAPSFCEDSKNSVWIIGKTFNFVHGKAIYPISIKERKKD
jgi:hypothetical protein